MAKPPTVVRDATDKWTLGWQGRLADRIDVPTPLVLVGRAVMWCVRRPYKTGLGGLLLVVTVTLGLWLALALALAAWVTHRILSSPGEAASGRSGRAYRACQARSKIRLAWPSLAAEAGLVDSSGRPVRFRDLKADETTATLKLQNGRGGRTTDDIRKSLPVLRALMNVSAVRVRELTPATSLLSIHFTDPLARTIRLAELPQVTTRSRVPLGLSELAEPILLNLTMSLLLLGLPRAGKSSIIWVILDGIQRWTDQPRPELYVIDLKEGVELGSLDPARGGIAKEYVQDPGKAEAMVHGLVREGRDRLKIMAENDWRVWTPARAGVLGPRKILIIDEFLALPAKMTQPPKASQSSTKKTDEAPLRTLLFLLPAAGITCIGASQLTQVDEQALGRLRNFFQTKILLAAESQGIVQAAGGGTAVSEAPAHKLVLPQHAGRFYIQEEGRSGWGHGKAAYVDDEAGEHLPIAKGRVLELEQAEGTEEDGDVIEQDGTVRNPLGVLRAMWRGLTRREPVPVVPDEQEQA